MEASNGVRIPVQCKQHKSPLGPRVVREFRGACTGAGAEGGMLVTTRGVTESAKDFADKNLVHVRDVRWLTRN